MKLMATTAALRNFPRHELACKGSGLLILAPGFGAELQALRDELNEAMVLTSACRSRDHNVAVGGHPRSLHVCDLPHHPTSGCCAVDVHAPAGERDAYRARLEALAWRRGWSVGIHPRFLHLDRRTANAGLPQARFNY